MKNLLGFLCTILCISCTTHEETSSKKATTTFTKTKFYTHPYRATDAPFKYKLDYFFENGKPHRWIELDSNRKVITEYIYEYDTNWKHIGARYREDGELNYNLEKVSYKNKTTKITEWLDSLGNPYYRMTDFLNAKGETYRAEFKGDKLHGYDSTFYTVQGFPKRIFFTNTKGKVFNDRSFVYDSITDQNEWIVRKKIMNDTIQEVQIKEIYTADDYKTVAGVFYEGIISTSQWSENTFSFTGNEQTMFVSRTEDWSNQFGVLHLKQNGIFSTSIPIPALDTIYNGAISPSGTKILYSKKKDSIEQVYLIRKEAAIWSQPTLFTGSSTINGGYFYWLTEQEVYFYTNAQNGNIVQGKLIGNELTIIDSLATLNTTSGTEFSPYVDREKRFIIFTRYLASDVAQQGFFISYNTGTYDAPIWSNPKKIKALPYGWNAFIINDGTQFLYTNGDDIMSVPIQSLLLFDKK
ncbi:MAG: hypothetical protein AAF611_18940 [Bacteroidota bacterium]